MKLSQRAVLGSEGVRGRCFGDVQPIFNHLSPREHVVPRSRNLASDVDPYCAVARGSNEDLRTFDVGLELLGEEVAQLLDCEPFDFEGAQPGQVDGAVRPDREGAAQLRNVEKLDLESVAGTQDVTVVGNSGALGGQDRCRCRGRGPSQ